MANVIAAADNRRKREAMEALVQEIISHGEDDNVSVSIRSCLERGWNFDFADCLIEARKKKEKEIDIICSRHSIDFLNSVQDLLRIQSSTQQLAPQIQIIHKELGSTGHDFLSVLQSLEALKKEQQETTLVLIKMNHCKEVATMMVKVREQISSDDCYAALETLQWLQQEQSKITVKQLQQNLQIFLPNQIDNLLSTVLGELQDMFTVLRAHRMTRGQSILRKYANLATGNIALKKSLKDPTSISLQYIMNHIPILKLEGWMTYEDLKKYIPDAFIEPITPIGEATLLEICDHLSPLLKALHVHNELGLIDSFHTKYRNIREPAMTANNMTASTDLDGLVVSRGLEAVLSEASAWTAGYFSWECVSRRLVEYPGGVFSWAEISELWERACVEIHDTCTKHMHTLQSPAAVIRSKEILLLFAGAMSDEAFSLRSTMIHNTITSFWENFIHIQYITFEKKLNQMMKSNKFIPLVLNDTDLLQKQLSHQIKHFKLHDVNLDTDPTSTSTTMSGTGGLGDTLHASSQALDALEESFHVQFGAGLANNSNYDYKQNGDQHRPPAISDAIPKSYPFSQAVVHIVYKLHQLLLQYLLFCVQNPRMNDKGDATYKSVFNCFDLTSDEYRNRLNQKNSTFEIICQVCADTAVLSKICSNFSKTVMEVLSILNWTVSSQTLSTATSLSFDTVMYQAQDQIFEYLNMNVESQLSTLKLIKWDAAEVSLPRSPHMQIKGIVDYMQTALSSVSFLPNSVHFLVTKVNKINMVSVYTLQLDVRHLETFADDCGIPQLSQCFVEFKVLVQAILLHDLQSVVESSGQLQSMFPALDPSKLAAVLEKVVNAPASVSAALPKYDKKVITNIVKKLRQSLR